MFTNPNLLELLVGQVWQVTILAVIARWLTVSVLKNQPDWSYRLWLLVMIKSITPPIWASHCGVFSWLFQRLSTETTAAIQAFSSSLSSSEFAHYLVIAWLLSALGAFAIKLLRWNQIGRQIHLASVTPSEELMTLVTQLANDLGIKRNFNFVLTRQPMGPLVSGVRTPTIVLPIELVEDKPIAKIEPVVAHELMHVKRGDTWVALLETIVRCVWWFHPEVQRAADANSQAGELCCDQDVLAQLKCPPRVYADSLVQVIESRCRLQPSLGQPGIRSQQLTRTRLERIMKFQETPNQNRSQFAIMILAMLLVLPGRPA